jgi:acyl-CoA thioesterase-1
VKKFVYFQKKCNFIVILFLLLGSQNIFSDTEKKMLILGDSLSAGYGIPSEKQWVKLVQQKLDTDSKKLKLINASLSGETTKGGLSRLPSLLNGLSPDFLFIELGANDALRGYPPSKVRSNLITMCELAKEKEIAIIIMQIVVAPNYGTKYKERLVRIYEEVATKFDAKLVPSMLNEEIVLNKDLMLTDGIHPNVNGQYVIADDLYTWISEL